VNKLQKKYDQVLEEKISLEKRLEIEEEYLVNKLQKQLDKVLKEKEELEHTLMQQQIKINKDQNKMKNEIEDHKQQHNKCKQ
jgi:coiled-coil domain-containing protein 6